MTIIWATIKDHNGYIDISSSQGQGTSITLYLLATSEQIPLQTREQTPLAHYSGNETILVVDDLKEQLTIAGNMLHKLGYTPITVQSGTEGLILLSQSSVDLVMLDMIMPGQMDGLETYEEILQLYPEQRAIVSSGYSKSDQVRRMQEKGAGAYIQKPYSMEELARAVHTELDR
ncbi:MAG: two-component system cell cycle sensor histidine kinase/response regulator CckA [Desulforhopalus sp.]